MKKLLALIPTMFLTLAVSAQWLNSGVYDEPLKDVLAKVGERYGVTVRCEEKNMKGRVVVNARWRFYDDVEATLDNILRPLDMRWAKKSSNVYEVKKWDYFRKPYEEGQKHLESLLAGYPDLHSWEKRKHAMRDNILSVLGLNRMKKTDLNPIRSNPRNHGMYTVENIALEVVPGVWVSGSLYKPAKFKGRIPAMLCPHGHFYNNVDKSIPNERGRYRPDQQYRCAMLASMGVAVFSYDMFAWGESALAFKQTDHRTDLGIIMQTWQGIRILDFLCAEPYINTERIGITGASGGGTQTMVLAAIDDRVALSVPTVMMASHFYGGCPCESGLPIHFIAGEMDSNNAELGAMVAPRPQLVISDGNDWTTTTPEIEMPYLKQVYGYYGAADAVSNVHLSKEKHDYGPGKRIAMYGFVAEHFVLDTKAVKDKKGDFNESLVVIEPATEMYGFGPEGVLPDHALRGADNLRALLKELNR